MTATNIFYNFVGFRYSLNLLGPRIKITHHTHSPDYYLLKSCDQVTARFGGAFVA